MNEVFVVKVGKSYHPWHKQTIKFEGSEDECLEWIKENLQEGEHAYIDKVFKVKKSELCY